MSSDLSYVAGLFGLVNSTIKPHKAFLTLLSLPFRPSSGMAFKLI